MKPNIELDIEELILHGFPPGSRYVIGDAVQKELTRLLVERGVPSPLALGGDYPLLDAGWFQLQPESNPKIIGVRIAGTLYQGLQPTTNNKERRQNHAHNNIEEDMDRYGLYGR